MPVFISDKHLKAEDSRKTYSDNQQQGFVLRTTPNGVFTYYYQFLNKKRIDPKTKKPIREWHLIGEHGQPDVDGKRWTPSKAREEAKRLAGLAVNKSLKAVRLQKIEAARVGGVTFQQLHDEYFAYCGELIERPWGIVPRKESWRNMQYSLSRALTKWCKRIASEITADDTMELYDEYVAETHPAQANCTRSDLRTMFEWGMNRKRKYVAVNPCPLLDEEDKAVERRHMGKKRVLTRDEIRTFWFGLNDPECPGDRFSKLALKLTLVSVLRSGEVVKLPTIGIADDRSTVTVPLKAVKSRRAKGATDVVQPMTSLAREILDEVYSIGNPERAYAFPAHRNQGLIFRPDRQNLKCRNLKGRDQHMSQQSLGSLMTRKSSGKRTRPGKGGINEFLGLSSKGGEVTPLVLRRTGATMLHQLGCSQALIGKVMTHKTKDKEAAPVTLEYIVDMPIIEQPVDPRIEVLDKLDAAFRKILGLKPEKKTCATGRRALPRKTAKKIQPPQPRRLSRAA
jgi:integrase